MSTEAMKLALEALNKLTDAAGGFSVSGVYFNEGVWEQECLNSAYDAIKALEEALAKQENLIPSNSTELEKQEQGEPKKKWEGQIDNDEFFESLKQEQGEPVVLKVYHGELCYKSQTDDQSFGMWCPVTQDLPFPEGTKFYTTPQQRKLLTDEQRLTIAHRASNFDWVGEYLDAVEFVIYQTEAAHGITEENT